MDNKVLSMDLTFLKELEKFSLESKMLICTDMAKRIMGESELSIDLIIESQIVPMELEIFIMYSIIYDKEEVKDKIDGKSFSEIITKIRQFRHEEFSETNFDANFYKYFMVTALNQFSTQGNNLMKLFRYDYIFNFSNTAVNMKEEFLSKFHSTYSDFKVFSILLFYCFSLDDDNPEREEYFRVLGKFTNIIDELTIKKEDFKREILAFYGDVSDLYYGLKLQYLYPFIEDTIQKYIPLPYLIVNSVSDSLLNRLTDNNDVLRGLIGKEVLEDYLFDIYRQINTVSWIRKEIKYIIKGKEVLSPDIIVGEGEYCTFIDTKALTPSLKVRQFNENEINKSIGIYAENLVRIYKQILNYEKELFELDKRYSSSRVFGVVVVLEDSMIDRCKIYESAIEKLQNESIQLSPPELEYFNSHIKIYSLVSLEKYLLHDVSFLPYLIHQSQNNELWYDIGTQMTIDRSKFSNIYKEYHDRTYNEIDRLFL